MKKTLSFGLTLVLFAAYAACTPSAAVKSGAAAGEALVRMLPGSTTGVMAIDVKRLMESEATQKALQDPEAKAKYDEFVMKSGIDPLKDIAYLGLGLGGSLPGGVAGMDGAVIVNLKYDQAKLQGLIKEKAPQAKETLYNGVTVYSDIEGPDSKSKTQAAFLDASHIVFGSEKGIKGIIDVAQKKADPLAKNPGMSAILKKVDKSGIAWGAFAVPPELIKKGVDASPQFKVLEGVTALTLAFDDRPSGVIADIRALGGTKDQNANLAQALTGFKAMGAMFAAEEPALNELLNGITISSGEDYTSLAISVSHEVMEKLGQMAQSKAGDFMKPKKDEPAPEVKK